MISDSAKTPENGLQSASLRRFDDEKADDRGGMPERASLAPQALPHESPDGAQRGAEDGGSADEPASDLCDWHEDSSWVQDWAEAEFYEAPTVEYAPQAFELSETNKHFAVVTGFFSPGSGALSVAHPVVGIAENLVLSVSIVFLFGIAMAWSIFPMGFLFAWVVLLFGIWGANVARVIWSDGGELRRVNVLGALFFSLLTFWFPFIFCFYVSSTQIIQRTWMSNETMSPTIEKGDAIFVNKRAFLDESPSYGDVVLVEDNYSENGKARHRAFFGRIIACPGDTVQLMGVHPYVNGKPLVQAVVLPHGAGSVPQIAYEIPYSTEVPAERDTAPARWYPIRLTSKLHFSQTNAQTLDEDFYYVLEDNRDIFSERIRNSYGAIVHRGEIKGKPLFILYNTDTEDIFSRYGFAVR